MSSNACALHRPTAHAARGGAGAIRSRLCCFLMACDTRTVASNERLPDHGVDVTVDQYRAELRSWNMATALWKSLCSQSSDDPLSVDSVLCREVTQHHASTQLLHVPTVAMVWIRTLHASGSMLYQLRPTLICTAVDNDLQYDVAPVVKTCSSGDVYAILRLLQLARDVSRPVSTPPRGVVCFENTYSRRVVLNVRIMPLGVNRRDGRWFSTPIFDALCWWLRITTNECIGTTRCPYDTEGVLSFIEQLAVSMEGEQRQHDVTQPPCRQRPSDSDGHW